jgi:hypothetical protein
MRKDMKALLKVLGWSFALVLAGFASIGMAVTVGWLTKEGAAVLILGCLMVGGVVMGMKFRSALFSLQPNQDKPDDPVALPDRRLD